MIVDGEIEPDLYRLLFESGACIDRELTGVSRQPSGDVLIVQPGDTSEADTVNEDQIAVGRVRMLTTRQGAVWMFPSNRLADAVQATPDQVRGMAFHYLSKAPFTSPALFIRTDAQITAMDTVLEVVTPAPTDFESPNNAPVEGKTPSTPPTPDTSPKAGAPAGSQESSPEQSNASPEDHPVVESQPDSPVLDESLPPADSPDGPSEHATASETLVVTPHDPVSVNVEDEPAAI